MRLTLTRMIVALEGVLVLVGGSAFATRSPSAGSSAYCHISAVGERIAELQRIRHAVLLGQQQAMTQVTSQAAQVSASAQAAVLHLRENQNDLLAPACTDHLPRIADRSEEMKQRADKFLDYGETQQKLQRLQTELELAG